MAALPAAKWQIVVGHTGEKGPRNSRGVRRRFHCRQLRPMRDQPVAVERNPFACVVTRFAGEPLEFGPTVIKLLSGFLSLHCHSLKGRFGRGGRKVADFLEPE